MGPAATVDFMAKLVRLTPAGRDQDHLPVVVANLPQIPNRSAAILGDGQDPLPSLKQGLELLNRAGAGVIVIPCNTSHHWYDALSAASAAPILHIAQAALERIPGTDRTLILATRGTLVSGFYQRALAARGVPFDLLSPDDEQPLIDDCIHLVKAGQTGLAGVCLNRLFRMIARRGVQTVLMACTELPLAATWSRRQDLRLIDCTWELARCTVDYALRRGWNCR